MGPISRAQGQAFAASKQAYAGGDGEEAHNLSMQGKEHQRKRDQLNAEAAQWIFQGEGGRATDRARPLADSDWAFVAWRREQQGPAGGLGGLARSLRTGSDRIYRARDQGACESGPESATRFPDGTRFLDAPPAHAPCRTAARAGSPSSASSSAKATTLPRTSPKSSPRSRP